VSIVTDIGEVFKKYLRGVLTVIVLYMTVMSIVFSILGMPYSILLALIAGTLYLVPMLGPLMSAAAIFIVTGFSGETGNWFLSMNSPWAFAAVLVGIFILVSTAFDQLVYPQLVGKAVDLHPLVSMFVVFSGGALFGLPGMLIAFPLAGSIKVMLGRLMQATNKPLMETLALPAVPLRHR
jgi:predicted PurR-regulated permease PerM